MSYVVYIVQVVLCVVYYHILCILYDIIVKKYHNKICSEETDVSYDYDFKDSSTESLTDDGYGTDVSTLSDSSNVTYKNTCIDPEKLITTTQLDELTLRKYMDSRCLRGYIAEYQRLSVEFMEEFIDDLPVHLISRHQTLPESFIRKYHEVLEMSTVSEYQELSNEFLNEFEPYIEFSFITRDKTTEEGYPCDEHCYQMDHPNFFSSNMECKRCKQEYLDSYEH